MADSTDTLDDIVGGYVGDGDGDGDGGNDEGGQGDYPAADDVAALDMAIDKHGGAGTNGNGDYFPSS